MFHYDVTDLSEGIHVAKSNNSKECRIFYYFFLIVGSKF